jgi:hypothetical protein
MSTYLLFRLTYKNELCKYYDGNDELSNVKIYVKLIGEIVLN